jgi:putative DNA primase/helicase
VTEEPTDVGTTDDPNVKGKEDDPLVALFIKTGFANKVRYDHMRSQWYYWEKTRWHVDRTKYVYDLVRQHTNRLYAQKKTDDTMVKMLSSLWNWSKKESFLKSLSAREEIAMEGTEWDTEEHLLGFDNGIMDLRTGVFDPRPSPKVLVSKTVGCDWNPDATYEEFRAFMTSILPDESVEEYVYALLGYCLWGNSLEQKFWMWSGRGGNGKGILARTMVHVLGDYADTPSNTLYMRTRVGSAPSNQARPDLIRLQGVRFTYMSEPPGGQFEENLLKAHSGDDVVLARDLYKSADQMSRFSPTHKIIFLTNEPPKTDDVGLSMRRRARLVKFEQDFDGSDKAIEARVRKEKQGILVALVMLAQRWWNGGLPGLPECAKVLEWSEGYMSDNDPLGGWIKDNCDLLTGEVTGSTVLYNDYQDWCARKNVESRSQTAFSIMLGKTRRKEKTRTGSQFHGIRLKPIELRAGSEEDDD